MERCEGKVGGKRCEGNMRRRVVKERGVKEMCEGRDVKESGTGV